MSSPARVLVAGVIAATSLATGEGEARAQAPVELPALPDAPAGIAPVTPPPVVAPPVLLSPAGPQPAPCTPGHCTHRGLLARKRCKRHLQEVFLGFPEEFERPALGALLHASYRVQVSNAEAASMVLYQYDFEPN